MTQSFQLLPSGDLQNDGWSLVGSNVTEVWEILSAQSDGCYIRCPQHRGSASVSFPIDSEDLPEGAMIDSVTVFIRMKTASGSGSRSVSVNVLSSENMSRYTSRTLTATSAFTTFEVGTYTQDPTGRAWDIHRINKLRLRVYCLNNLFDSINISELYVQVNYHTKPTVQVIEPTGTQTSPSPIVKWVYTQAEGEPQSEAQVKIFTAEQVAAVTIFNPDTEEPIATNSDNGASGSGWRNRHHHSRWRKRGYRHRFRHEHHGGTSSHVVPAPTSETPVQDDEVYDVLLTGSATEHAVAIPLVDNAYRVYVRAWSDHDAKSDWAYRDFIVDSPSPGVPGDDNAGTSGTPGVGVPSAIPDTFTSSAQLRMRDASNLLSVQQADFEVPSDPLEYIGSDAALARDTLKAFNVGGASLKVTAAGSADAFATSTKIEVSPSTPITVRSQFLAGSTGRTVKIIARFYDVDFTLLSADIVGTGDDVTATWTEIMTSGVSPATAAYCEVVGQFVSPAPGEVHYMDRVGLMYGVDSAWTSGGHQSRNLLSAYLATGDDPTPTVDTWEQSNIATVVSRTAVTGIGSHGSTCHQMSYQGSSTQIGFRATGTVYATSTAGTSYTLNKPAGTTANDLLLAFVTSTEHGTIVPPAGWVTANTASVDDGSTDIALYILKRTATSTDPSAWTTGKMLVSSSRRTAVVVAYSGAADASDQFIADSVKSDTSGALVHRTQIVSNTDPNAWRVAAFAVSDDVTGGTFSANQVTPAGTDAAAIRFVSASSKWIQSSQTTSYTIQRPSGVQSGDLMIASVCFSGRIDTVNAPSGWTLVRRETQEFPNSSGGDAHSGDVTMAVFKRTAGSSEPQSWTASHTDWGQPKISQVVAYRNCADASQQFVTHDSGTAVNTSTVSTPEVTNTDSRAWRVCIFGATTPFRSSWSYGDVSERCDSSSSKWTFPDAVLMFSDSNGQVSTGNHKRTAKINSVSNQYSNVPSGNFYTAAAWIGIIKPLAAPPSQPANEAERVDNRNGSSNPWLNTAVYDSNGVIPTGATSLYGQFTPGSGTSASSMASWIGIIKPSAGSPGGLASARTSTWVDIADLDEGILDLAGNKVTVMSSFLGSTDGTPILGAEFSRANQVISSAAATGVVFNTTTWTKSWATFQLPDGTTRIRPILSATDRAVGDSVKFDRVGIMLGAPEGTDAPLWRNGTSRTQHVIWSKPLIQYTDDAGIGYESWTHLPGQAIIPPAFRSDTGQLAYVDHSIVPLNRRKYRVQTLSYGLQGDIFASGWGPESDEVSLSALNWWLKDFSDLSTALRLRVKYEDVVVTTDNTASVFQPLGADFPIVVTEGYKADSLTVSVFCDRQEEAALYALLRSGKTLLLQSDTDYAWWVRPVDALETSNLAVSARRRTTDPIKVVTCKFVQVQPEE